MKIRKAFVWVLTIVFCVSIVPFSSAADFEHTSIVNTVDFSELANNPDVSVSEPLTFTEMVELFAKNENVSYQEAYNWLGGDSRSVQPRDINRRVFSVRLDVAWNYKPTLDFYCETAEGGHFYQIHSIYSVQLNREYNGKSKQFAGDIEVWLRTGSIIEYIINGDFYDNGTTTIEGGGSINLGVNQRGTLSFSVSYLSDHFKYFYDTGEFHWGNE